MGAKIPMVRPKKSDLPLKCTKKSMSRYLFYPNSAKWPCHPRQQFSHLIRIVDKTSDNLLKKDQKCHGIFILTDIEHTFPNPTCKQKKLFKGAMSWYFKSFPDQF